MKNTLLIVVSFILFTSCSDQKFDTVNMRINHYQDAAVGLDPQLVYLVQEDEKIGTDDWSYFYSSIDGFEYESGYRYNLSVKKTPIDNPPADASSIKYELKEIVSKEKVAKDMPFEVTLKLRKRSYVTGNKEKGFNLLQLITIDCQNLCEELSAVLAKERSPAEPRLTGTFHHAGQDTIKLVEL